MLVVQRKKNLDPGVDVLPALVECRQVQLDGVGVLATPVDELDGSVSQLVHLTRPLIALTHQLLHSTTK